MSEENKNNEKKNELPDVFENIFRSVKNHKATPSEKIVMMARERDLIYDKINNKNKELEELTDKNCDDALFLNAQIANLKEQKKLLGDRIKKLVDET